MTFPRTPTFLGRKTPGWATRAGVLWQIPPDLRLGDEHDEGAQPPGVGRGAMGEDDVNEGQKVDPRLPVNIPFNGGSAVFRSGDEGTKIQKVY